MIPLGVLTYNKGFKFQIVTTTPNETFTLPINDGGAGYTQNFIVSWGDNTSSNITAYNDGDRIHTYISAGTYNIELNGICEWFAFNNTGDKLKITKLIAFTKDMGFKVLNFHGCSNLNTLLPLGTMSALTTGLNMFYSCSSITSIPSGMFDGCPAIIQFSHVFSDCTSLVSIPTDLFRYCTLVTNMTYVFNECTSLTSIPIDIFRYNTAINSMVRIFTNCSSLVTVPIDTFRYNTLNTSFSYIFYGCTSLISVPVNLFKYNTIVTNFYNTFFGCIKLQLNKNIFYADGDSGTRFLNQSITFSSCFNRSSFTGIQGVAPDLWNCNFGTGTPTKTNCYGGLGNSLTSLSNYADIPVAWK